MATGITKTGEWVNIFEWKKEKNRANESMHSFLGEKTYFLLVHPSPIYFDWISICVISTVTQSQSQDVDSNYSDVLYARLYGISNQFIQIAVIIKNSSESER